MADIKNIYDKPATKRFLCTILASEIELKAEEEIKKIALTAQVNGFRKGHAPESKIKELYQGKAYNDAMDAEIRNTIESIAKENNYKLASSPEVKFEKQEESKDIIFEVSFELVPEISHIDYKKIEVVSFEPTITEESIAEEMQNIAKSNTEYEDAPADAVSANGSVVSIDSIGSVDGVPFDGGKLESYDLNLGSGTFIPGFEEQLIGKKAGDEVMVNVTFPEEYHAKNLAGKVAIFDTKVLKVKTAKVPEVTEEFVKKMGIETGIEGLKADIKKRMQSFYKNAHKEVLKKDVMSKLSSILSFDLPEGLVLRVANDMAKKENLPEEDAVKFIETATSDLRISFYLNFIMADQNIKVTEQDFTNFIIQTSQYMGMNPMELMNIYTQNKDARKKAEALLEENKIYDYIFNNIEVKYEEMEREKLEELLKAANA